MATITDSTTTLTTAWTENSIPVFTTGVLSDMDACITEVESKLKRGTLGASSTPTLTQAQNWLKRAKLEISEAFGFEFKRKYAYCDLTANTYVYSLPPDYDGGRISLKDTTNNREIPVWTSAWYDLKFPDPSEENSDQVLVACIKNMELWVAPPPNGSDRIELEYPRSGAETTADDFSWLPELMRYRCCDFAQAEAFESLHMFEHADRYRMKFEAGVMKAKRADTRKRWQGKKMSAISVFQHYRTGNYQPNT